jgi:hypothetical protein
MHESASAHHPGERPDAVDPLRCRGTLDGFGVEPGCADGVALDTLEPGSVLEVTTRHSQYRMLVVGPRGRALVTGGARFHEPTEVRIEGATAGGSVLKCGWIGVGLRLELSIGRRRVLTSTVDAVCVLPSM